MLTTREVIKTFYNALKQKLKSYRGNWDQNDPNADDYIKNRPFYTDESEKMVIVPKQELVSEGYTQCLLELPELTEFVVGQTYEVKWDNDIYHCVAFDLDGIAGIGNTAVFNDNDSGEPFIMMISKEEGMGMALVLPAGTYNVEVTSYGKVVKLDKKYLPDLGLAPVAYSNNYWDLEERPNTYEDVVRYKVTQSLTAAEKRLARTNIGAGNFNGNYNNLTNKPNIITTEAMPIDNTFSFVQDEITSGRDAITVNGFKYYKISDLVIPRENYVSCSGIYCRSIKGNITSENKSANYNEFVYGENCINPITGVIIVESVENGMCELPISSTSIASFIAPSVGIYAMYEVSYGNKYYCQSIKLHYQTKKPYLNTIPVNSGDGIFDIMVNKKGVIYTKDENGNIISSGFASEPQKSIALVDQVNGYTYIACMREGNFVTYCAIKSIEVTAMPTKIEYIAGELFDTTGMVITATTYDNVTKEITDYICPTNYLTEGTTSVEITYVEAGIEHIAIVPITVSAFDAASVLVDFDYTDNGDGTYTIIDWKRTYNGESSTEMIIPDNHYVKV